MQNDVINTNAIGTGARNVSDDPKVTYLRIMR